MLGLCCCVGAVTFLVEHWLQAQGLQQLWFLKSRAWLSMGSVAPLQVGSLPDQGSNLCPLHWQADSLPLSHQETPLSVFGIKLITTLSLVSHR